MKKILGIFVLMGMLLMPCVADAHPGRLDSNGGHYNRKTGEYHYHRGGGSSSSSSRSTKSKSTTSTKKSTKKSATSKSNNTTTATVNNNMTVDERLKANGFFLSEEIEEAWKKEQTPDVIKKLTTDQQKAIVAELRKAQDEAAKSSQDFGKGIKNASDRAEYQEGVRKNKVLKATRAIAKKYGIQAGDIFVVEFHVVSEGLK